VVRLSVGARVSSFSPKVLVSCVARRWVLEWGGGGGVCGVQKGNFTLYSF